MCRLLAWRSEVPLTPREVLGADADQLAELSRVHCDGWGYGRVGVGPGITVQRGAEPAHRSAEFLAAVEDEAATAGLVHLRWATEGLAVSIGNTHPFIASGRGGPVAFIHNGMVPESADLLPHVDADLQAEFRGNTDSEHYFGVLMTELRRADGDVVDAYRRTAKILADYAYTSINSMILTPTTLAVASLHKPENRSPDVPENYFHLTWGVHEGVVSAWSMGVRPHAPDQRPLDNGHLLTVDLASGTIDVVPIA